MPDDEGMTAARSPGPAAARGRGAAPGAPPGPRERKRVRTRAAIRGATYALAEEEGYEAATVERIAGRAEVSPSTVPRHFPVKEDIVLTDASGPLPADGPRTRPAGEPLPDLVDRAPAVLDHGPPTGKPQARGGSPVTS